MPASELCHGCSPGSLPSNLPPVADPLPPLLLVATPCSASGQSCLPLALFIHLHLLHPFFSPPVSPPPQLLGHWPLSLSPPSSFLISQVAISPFTLHSDSQSPTLSYQRSPSSHCVSTWSAAPGDPLRVQAGSWESREGTGLRTRRPAGLEPSIQIPREELPSG